MDMAALEDAMQDQTHSNVEHTNPDTESHNTGMTSSSMDLENRLLKNEIASLNQEMASLVQRAKDSETGLITFLKLKLYWKKKITTHTFNILLSRGSTSCKN